MTPCSMSARLYLFPSTSETLLVRSGDLPHPLPNWHWVVPTPHLLWEVVLVYGKVCHALLTLVLW